jgi:hypothetical protein
MNRSTEEDNLVNGAAAKTFSNSFLDGGFETATGRRFPIRIDPLAHKLSHSVEFTARRACFTESFIV